MEDVDDWARSVTTYETLLGYLKEEAKYAETFAARRIGGAEEEMGRERKRMQGQLDALDKVLTRSASERVDLLSEAKRRSADGEARRLQDASNEATKLRERLAELERAALSREELSNDQLGRLKEAFRGDVAALATWVEELRKDSLQANVYARTSTRLLRQQNGLLKKRIGHNALLAKQRQRRLVAWLGWRLVVQQGKALQVTSERRQREVGDRNGMIEHLEGRLGQTRSKYLRQLHSLQLAHESELEAAREEVKQANEAMSRLKTFSAHKLSEMAAQLEKAHEAGTGGQEGGASGDRGESGAAFMPIGGGDELFSRGQWTDSALLGPGMSAAPLSLPVRPLNLQPVHLLSQEKQLTDAAALVQRLERKLRRAAAAEAQLEEHKQLAGTVGELQATHAAQAEQAAKRIAELEAELQRRDAEVSGSHQTGEEAATRQRLEAQAEADAAAALAAGPRALAAARSRRDLTRLRARVAGHALRQWSRGRTAVCVRAWCEFVWRCKAERAAAAAAEAYAAAARVPRATKAPVSAAVHARISPTPDQRRRGRVAAAMARGGRPAYLPASTAAPLPATAAAHRVASTGAIAAAQEISAVRPSRSVAAAVAAEQVGVPYRGQCNPRAASVPPLKTRPNISPTPAARPSTAAAAAAAARVALNARLQS